MNTKKLSNAKKMTLFLDKPTRSMLEQMALKSGMSMSAVLRDVVNHSFETIELIQKLKNN